MVDRRDIRWAGLAAAVWAASAAAAAAGQTAAPAATAPAASPRGRLHLSLNHGWRFARVADVAAAAPFDDAGWESVDLPHTVRLEPYDASGGRNYQGLCQYQRHFRPDSAWRGRTLLVRFEAAMSVADVWLNGRRLGTHYGGYLPFTIDVTAAVRFDADNVLSVRLDNADDPDVPPGKPQKQLDFCYFGGLYRDAWLDVVDPVHVTDEMLADTPAGGGVFVSYPAVTDASATVRVQADVANDAADARSGQVRQSILDADGKPVASASLDYALPPHGHRQLDQTLTVARPRLWDPNHPNLYTLRTAVTAGDREADAVDTTIGIRTFDFADGVGLRVNGRRFVSLGCNRHQDHPYVGYALSDAAQWRDAVKLRQAGFTSVRIHYPQSPAFVDACDRLGMLLIVSNPGWQFAGGPAFVRREDQDCREMVRRDRNHAAVVLWEAALNETDNRPAYAELQRIVHQEYPFAPCYTAGDRLGGPTPRPAWDLTYDAPPPAARWIREAGDHVDNWADQQSTVRVDRAWGEAALLAQAWAHARAFDAVYAADAKPGRGHGRLAGVDLWAGVDAYRGYHHQPFLGGPFDLFRLPKFDAYLFASQRPPDVHVPGVDDGPMVFIANYASVLSPTDVTVFSNCQQVRLLQNGKPMATQGPLAGFALPHPPFVFKTGPFAGERSTLYMTNAAGASDAVGRLTAEGLIDGKVVATHAVREPGVAAGLALEADLAGRPLRADGADFVRLYARVVDRRGTVQPLADDEVTFSVVDGDARVVDDARIRANPVRAAAGIATALVRAGRRPGPVRVRAEAFGLRPAEVTFDAEADPVPAAP